MISMPSVQCIRFFLRSPSKTPTFSSSLATSCFGCPGRAAASCSASAAAKPSSSSPPSERAIGDETAEEEALCLLDEAAVCGALISLLREGRCKKNSFFLYTSAEGDSKERRERDRRERNESAQSETKKKSSPFPQSTHKVTPGAPFFFNFKLFPKNNKSTRRSRAISLKRHAP